MEHNLISLLRERVASGLQQKAVTTCSRWAETYRMMGQPYPGLWSFKHHPWTRDMHDCKDEMIVGQKAAQMGYTETALNKVFYNIDSKGISCLYILPSEHPDAANFSTSRFDPALEMSAHLSNMFSDVKNIGHKRAGSASLYVRGSRSRSQMKSIPVGFIVFDEVDEMVQENIPLAMERVSGQVEWQLYLLSTPTIENRGINVYFNNSTQDHFFFTCPHCSKWTELLFPDCLVITAEDENDMTIGDSHLVCKECKHKLDHAAKADMFAAAKWIPTFTDRESHGFYINQLYSMTVHPKMLAKSYLRSLKNPADEQEFYNSKLGIVHAVEGARITDANLDSCIGDFRMKENVSGVSFITMGVDVGKMLHYEIVEWSLSGKGSDVNTKALAKVLSVGKVEHFEELDSLMQRYVVSFCVIDANPERRKALEFAQRFYGHVRLCYYGNNAIGKTITIHPETDHTITVDRTSWLDMSLSRFKNNTIRLPFDIPTEYKAHIMAPVRIYKNDKNGNPVGRYENDKDDHYAHAHNYAEIALPLGAGMGKSYNITGVM